MSLFKQNECFYRVKFFLDKIKFFERGYKYLFWITFFEKKKIFTGKNNFFLKIIHIFFLKILFFK